jgi:chemotaxis protein methyltransferase CheR
MNVTDFELIAQLLKERSGLALNKESFFFRDQKPFDQFRTIVLPHLLQARTAKRSIRIWSAACSSGQEPYTLAMLLNEHADKLAGWRVEIVATDLSNEILDKAKEGLYSQFEVQRGLPISRLVKYFTQVGDRWKIDDSLRKMVKFQQYNLLGNLGSLGRFDVVFCRNVLIYFDTPTKTSVLEGIAGMMAPDGFLYLGGAETVLGTTDRFQIMQGQRGIYSLTASAPAAAKAAS